MELPRAALNIQRVLAAVLLAIVICTAIVERSSPIASSIRSLKPWPFWLMTRAPGRSAPPIFHLGVYDPLRRSLVLIRVPDTTRLQGKMTLSRIHADALRATEDESSAQRAVIDLAQAKLSSLSPEPISWEGAGRLALELAPLKEDEEEPAAEAALALKLGGRSAGRLFELFRRAVLRAAQGDVSAADPLLLTLELRRVPLESLEPAVLPDDASAPAFLARAFAPRDVPEAGDEAKAIVVEVFNGTEAQGLAAQATKVLRSKGMDAMVLGRARPRSRTHIYDRTGDFDRAARVRAALGCPAAIAATRIDVLRGVDVSIELGEDCRF